MMKPSQENCLFWHHRDSLSESYLRAMGRGLNLVWGIQADGCLSYVLFGTIIRRQSFCIREKVAVFIFVFTPKKRRLCYE